MNIGKTLFAQLMDFLPYAQARKLYGEESLGIELGNTVYALDSTTIDLCLSLFALSLHQGRSEDAYAARSVWQ